MKKLEIYDPALCCSTGVCGPSPDTQLTVFASVLGTLKGRVEVNRYNLSQQPGAFASNAVVNQVLREEGPDALPVILIDGKLVLKGIYPTADQLSHLLGIEEMQARGGDDSECCGSNETDDCCATDKSSVGQSDCCDGTTCC